MNLKVICITDIDPDGDVYENCDNVVVGRRYTAIEDVIGYGPRETEAPCFVIKEVPRDRSGEEICFNQAMFAPCSDIDETEMIREQQTAAV